MSSITAFLSDLHLDDRRPAITQLFLDYLDENLERLGRLFILGDLFEAWIGDDYRTPLSDAVAGSLERLGDSGVEIYYIHGNRDFLLGREYADRCRMTLLTDPSVIDLHGTRCLIGHGDIWCTDDEEYQAVREQVRDPAWQQDFLARDTNERLAFAISARAQSRAHTAEASEAIMDVNPDAIRDAMLAADVDLMIHGHTHRPAVHEGVLGDGVGQRIVLGDWYQQGSVLECSPGQFELRVLPLNN